MSRSISATISRHLFVVLIYLLLAACSHGGSDSSGSRYSISLNTNSLSFTANQSGSNPAAQTVSVNYQGDGVIIGYPEVDPGWLNVTVVGSQLANPLTISIAVNNTFLSPGTYHATVRFLTGNLAGTDGTYVDLDVQYVVQPADAPLPPTPIPTPAPADSISLNKSSMSFSYVLGRDNNVTESVVTVYSASSWTASASDSWITLNTTSGSGSGDVTVGVNASGLTAGSYNGNVVFTQTSTGKQSTISIYLSVTDGGIVLSSPTAHFYGVNGKAIATQNILVTLDGGGAANWSASTSDSWLTLNGSSSPVTGASATSLQIGIDAQSTKLASGDYTGVVNLTSTFNSVEHTATVTVTLHLTPMTLSLSSSTTMSFSGINGSTIPTQSRSISLNTDVYEHPWTASSPVSWLKVNGGSSASGTNSGSLVLSIDAASLSSQTYNTSVTVTANVNGDTLQKTIPVSLTLTKPTISLSSSSLSFTAVNGDTITDKSVTIRINTGDNAYTWNAVIDDGGNNWLKMSALSGNASVTATGINVGVDTSSLSSNRYNGSILITAVVNGDTIIANVSVLLALTKPSFSFSPSSLSFGAVNGTPIDAKPVAISLNTGANAYDWTAEINDGGNPGSDWLVLDTSAGSTSATPGNINAGIDATLLSSGAYSGSVTLTAQVHGDTVTADIPVSLILTLPTLTFTPPTLSWEGVNGSSFTAQDVGFSVNTGTAVYPWTASISADKGVSGQWLVTSDSLTGSVSSSAATVSLNLDTTDMLGDVYNGSVDVSVTINGDTVTGNLPVSFRLEPHQLFVADDGVALSSFPTDTSVLSHTVSVADNGGLATSWSAAKTADWLTITTSGTTNGDLVITANPAGLSTGVLYTDEVTVTSADPTIENLQHIRVGFWVGSDPDANKPLSLTYSEAETDPIRPYVYLHNNGTDIDIYNIYTATLVNTITSVGGNLGDMEASSDGSTLYVADNTSGAHAIVPVNLDTLAVGTPWTSSNLKTTSINLAYIRPGGRAVIFADDGYIYDAVTGDTSLGALNMAFYQDWSYYIGASLQGNKVCGINSGISPYTVKCYGLTYSALEGGILTRTGTGSGPFGIGSYGKDIALSTDGSKVYTAASQAGVQVYDGETMERISVMTTVSSPIAVNVGSNGFVYAGLSSIYGPTDVGVFDTTGVEQLSTYVSGYAKTILERQLVVSGDAKRMIILTSDPKVVFLSAF